MRCCDGVGTRQRTRTARAIRRAGATTQLSADEIEATGVAFLALVARARAPGLRP